MENKLIRINGIYEINDLQNVHVIEIEAIENLNDLDVSTITQVIDDKEQMSWQVPYDEKYLNSENKMIGDWLEVPKSLKKGEKIIFFFHYINSEKPLKTQYGDLETPNIIAAPKWVSELMDYQEP